MRFEDEHDYWNFVEMIVENRQGLSPRTLATKVIVAPVNQKDEKLLLMSAGPFIDDDVQNFTRLWPGDVITGRSHEYPFPADLPDDLRELAVELLARDIQKVITETEAEA